MTTHATTMLTFTVSAPIESVVEALMKVADKWKTSIMTGFQTKLWNANYCYGRVITVGPLNPPTNRGGVGGGGDALVYSCRTEWWRISCDGGVTWSNFFSEVFCTFGPRQPE